MSYDRQAMRATSTTRRVAAALAVVAWAGAGDARAGAGGAGFWDRVADPNREKFERLMGEATALLGTAEQTGNRALAVRAEALLGQAQALEPDEFDASYRLGQAQQILDRPVEAVASFERALRTARLSAQEAQCSLALGIERSKIGRYVEALADYDRRIRLGGSDATTFSNSAEVLMVLGRLGEAADRYREAIRIGLQATPPAGDKNLVLAYLGLAVALDRDDQPGAAREAMAQAQQRDPNMAILRSALEPNADVFFVPDGDVYYYLGLAHEVAGRTAEAEQAFRRFQAAQGKGSFARRAQQHLDALAARGSGGAAGAPGGGGAAPGGSAPAGGLRLKVVATVRSKGPIDSPIIDAAWHAHPPPVEPCFGAAYPSPPSAGVRVTVQVDIGADGEVASARARPPAGAQAASLRSCIESAVKKGLRVPPAPRRQRTAARIELFLAPPRPTAI